MRKSVVTTMALLLAAVGFGAATGTITTEGGDVLKGEIRWSVRDKAYAVTKGNTEVQVRPTDIARFEINKPAGYDAAVAKVQSGQGAAAIPVLQKIVKNYQRLQWDKTAGRYLAEAYIAAGHLDDGLRTCEAIISSDASAAYKGDLAPAYWQVLLELGRKVKLEGFLEKAIKGGDRFSAGAAYILRGDKILKEDGESNDAVKKALTDGYLRTVFMYADDDIADRLQPEALYKAARCFERLGQSGRADTLRAKLKQSYGTSIWAAK